MLLLHCTIIEIQTWHTSQHIPNMSFSWKACVLHSTLFILITTSQVQLTLPFLLNQNTRCSSRSSQFTILDIPSLAASLSNNNDEEILPTQTAISSSIPSNPSTPSPILGSTTHTDIDEECPEESCLLSHIFPENETTASTTTTTNSPFPSFASAIFNPVLIIPLVSPILAYMSYDEVARLFNGCIDFFNKDRSWMPVDGGQYQARIIAPAINGIIVPAISILFATLISNTVATLRQRQIDIHTSLNLEAGDLRVLSIMVDAFPQSYQRDKCREYLAQYTSRLIAESNDRVKLNSLEFQGSTDSEMNGFVSVLNELTNLDGVDDTNGDNSRVLPHGTILSESYSAVVRLNTQRSSRITSLQATFPTLHYAILSTLAGSVCLAFLIETNQDILIFLNAIQLRILWTMLIGTFSALAVVCYDLSGPFRGQYQISNAVYQLMTIRDTLRAVIVDESEND